MYIRCDDVRHLIHPLILLDTTIRGNWKAGEVIRDLGEGSPPAAGSRPSRERAPGGVRGKAPGNGGLGGAPRSLTGFNDYI